MPTETRISGCPCCGSGSGPGSVQTACCAEALPGVLCATFGGALAGLGTVALTYAALTGSWEATVVASACGNVYVVFGCISGSGFYLSISTDSSGSSNTLFPASCDPLLWSATGTVTGACSGNFTVDVTETAP